MAWSQVFQLYRSSKSRETAHRVLGAPQRRTISPSILLVTGGLVRSRVLCVPLEYEGTKPAEVRTG